jgi:hypothetical protein
MAPLGPPGGAGQAGAAHQQGDSVVADQDPAAQPQFGVHPQGAVGATRALVDLDDQVGQPDMRIALCDGGRDRQA